jgi:hypothetical protein
VLAGPFGFGLDLVLDDDWIGIDTPPCAVLVNSSE